MISAMILLASRLDEFKNNNHPDNPKSSFQNDMKIILDESEDKD